MRGCTSSSSWAALGLLAVTVLTPLAAQQPFPSGDSGAAFVIRNVRIFDGLGSRDGQSILVRDGRIAAVGERLEIPGETSVVDGTGHTLFPGMIDAHTHAFDRQILAVALTYGVTTLLDQFTVVPFATSMRTEQAAGDVTDRADLFSAGTLATDPTGHGTQYGFPIPTVSGPGDAEEFVAARKAEGSDWLKIIWEDGSLYDLDIGSLDAETVGALIRAADDNGLRSVVHVSLLEQAFGAAEMGATGLVHAPQDRMPGADDGAVLVAAGLFMAPTLTITRSIATGEEGKIQLADERLAERANAALRGSLAAAFPSREATSRAYDHAKELTRQMHAAGGVILAGTDAPNPGTAYGLSMHRELELLVDAGLTPTEALEAATAATAAAFGLDDRGRIAPGLRADLVLVEGDPTTDITDTRNLVAIWRNGALVPEPQVATSVAEEGAGSAPQLPVPGLVSDFDDGTTGSTFGGGWIPSTDQMMGGSSTVELVTDGGVLTLEGEVVGNGFTTWSGTNFFPGSGPMDPSDLSGGTGIRFRIRGQGPGVSVMVFAQSLGQIPAVVQHPLTTEWTTLEIPFADFPGADPSGLMAFFIGQAGRAGTFKIQIDDVEIY